MWEMRRRRSSGFGEAGKHYDIVVVGGGIVGAATAWQVKQLMPAASVLLVEKETRPGCHQTGHNSGVIHAGVYYQPGSLKADFCRRGLTETFDFCREHGIAVEQCGKLLVATDEMEYERMVTLEVRCQANRIETARLSASELREREPLIRGEGALFVPSTGITDYRVVAGAMVQCFREIGGDVLLGAEVRAIREDKAAVRLLAAGETIQAGYLLVCGGLMADRLARMMGIAIDFRIIPFRGEYYRLPATYRSRIRHLIYPIPDPSLPFLGVHLTKMIDGTVTVGPNAVLGWKREGYGRLNVSLRDLKDILGFPGTWRLFRRHFASGMAEFRDSIYKPGYLKRVRNYCPSVQLADLMSYPAGIRAQAVLGDGTLVHDFLFARSPRSLHVCNAPSPAATSALPIGRHLAGMLMETFRH